MFAVDITHSLQTLFLNHSPFLCISLKDSIKLPLQTSLIFCVGSLDVSISFIFFSLENSRFLEIWKWPNAIRGSRIFTTIK